MQKELVTSFQAESLIENEAYHSARTRLDMIWYMIVALHYDESLETRTKGAAK